MSQLSNPNPFTGLSGKKPNCIEMLQFILDNEASHEQKEYFKTHMDICMPCFKSYELDMSIRQLIKSKCCGGDAPADLVKQIREQIAQKLS